MWILKALVTVDTAPFWADILEPFCLSVSFYENPDTLSWTLEGLTEEEPALDGLQNLFKEATPPEGITPLLTADVLPDRHWLEENKQSFPPLTIGPFYLYGSHHNAPPPPDTFPLLIEAATAFGSGHHGTTLGCLLLLEKEAREKPWTKPLDLGCGSGILALAMACLNPKARVLALDNDPEAIAVATHNTQINGKEEMIDVALSEGLSGISDRESFDLIVANILAQPLIDMASSLHNALMPGGSVILSGFLDTQWPDVQGAYIAQGFEPSRHIVKECWVSLCLRKADT